MGKVIIEEQNLIDIANSIRSKLDTTDTFKPSEMNEAINSIKTSTPPEKGLIINEYDSDGYPTDVEIVGLTEIPDNYLAINSSNSISHYFGHLSNVKIPNNTTKIGENSFSYGYFESINLPDTITEIKYRAFNYCKNLVLDKLPNGLTKISGEVFSSCSSITSLNLPDTLTEIGRNAFQNSGITEINIPSGVNVIEGMTFYGCKNLTTVIMESSTPPTMSNAFYLSSITSGTGFIYVPDESVDVYKSADGWSTYASQIKGISELEG